MTGTKSFICVVLALACRVAGASDSGMPRFVYQDEASITEPAHAVHGNHAANWHVQIEPMARYVSPAGDVRLAGSTIGAGAVDLADVNLNAPRLMPGFDLSLRRGDWRINAIGLFYDIDNQIASAESAFELGSVGFAAGERSSPSWTLRSTLTLKS
mgnify:FL=1